MVFLREDNFFGATDESQEICATITMVKKKSKPLIHLAQTLIASNLFVSASSESRQSIIERPIRRWTIRRDVTQNRITITHAINQILNIKHSSVRVLTYHIYCQPLGDPTKQKLHHILKRAIWGI